MLMERVVRFHDAHPAKLELVGAAGAGAVWRVRAEGVAAAAGLTGRCGVPRPPPPWEVGRYGLSCGVDLVRRVKKTDPVERQKKAAQDTLDALPRADATVYTDGSVRDPQTMGPGSASYVVYDARGARHAGAEWVAPRSSSYMAEFFALWFALGVLLREDVAVPRGGVVRRVEG